MQPAGPRSCAGPGSSGATPWAGWLSTVSAVSDADAGLLLVSVPVTVPVLCTALWPSWVATLHVYVQRSPGLRKSGEESPFFVTRIGAALHIASPTATLAAENEVGPGSLTTSVYSTAVPARADAGPLLSIAMTGGCGMLGPQLEVQPGGGGGGGGGVTGIAAHVLPAGVAPFFSALLSSLWLAPPAVVSLMPLGTPFLPCTS